MLLKKTNKISKVIISDIDNLEELRRRMEEVAHEYLCSLQVQEENFIKRDSHKIYKGIKGYFMVHDVDKITIYNRTIEKGYLYNYTVLRKITTFSIIRHKNIGFKSYQETGYMEMDKLQQKIDNWRELHEDIIDYNKNDAKPITN